MEVLELILDVAKLIFYAAATVYMIRRWKD